MQAGMSHHLRIALNPTSALPTWLQYVQLIAVLAIPLLAALIAYEQMRIARMKLNHDRYERRLKIFEAAHALLAEAVTTDAISDDVLKRYFADTVAAPFHFNDDIVRYLEKVGTVAGALRARQSALQHEADQAKRDLIQTEADSELLWCQQELQTGRLVNTFRRDLALDPRQVRSR
jgi:hypothetical protein